MRKGNQKLSLKDIVKKYLYETPTKIGKKRIEVD